MQDFNLEERKELLIFARFCLENEMDAVNNYFLVSPNFIEKYSDKLGIFISLYNKKELRACLGQMNSDLPFYKTIELMTSAAATRDYRFKPIKKKEVDKLKIEISIISPMCKIDNIAEIELGKHGIYIEKDGVNGTFLPQVAENYNWTLEEFLGHCSESKVGIGWNGWKDANIFVYETVVFKESGI